VKKKNVLKELEKEIKILDSKFKQLMNSDFISFQTVAAHKNVTGVYVIYNHKSEILYIGSTNKFNIRFGTDLKHESTHTLVRKLIQTKDFKDRHQVLEFLKNKCKIKIKQCINKREAEALEHIAIYILKPVFNK